MTIVRILSVLVTTLMALMNLGVVLGSGEDTSAAQVVAGGLLFLVGAVAAAGLAANQAWGRPAVLLAAALNLAGAVVALAAGWEGAVVGLAASVLALASGWFSGPRRSPVAA